MRLAKGDIGKHFKFHTGKGVAGCFAVPWIHQQKIDGGDITAQLEGWLENVKTSGLYDALAWVFPMGSRNLKSTYANNKKDYYYPGVVLLLKKVDKRKSAK